MGNDIPNFPKVDWKAPLEHLKGATGKEIHYVGIQDVRDHKQITDGCHHLVLVRGTGIYYDDYGRTPTGNRVIWNKGKKEAKNPDWVDPNAIPPPVSDKKSPAGWIQAVNDRLTKLEEKVDTRLTKLEAMVKQLLDAALPQPPPPLPTDQHDSLN